MRFPPLEVDCGAPPPGPHSVMLWDNITTVGSQVVYQCNSGFRNVGEGNVSVCSASGKWEGVSPLCQGDNAISVLDYLHHTEVMIQSSPMLTIHHNFHAVIEQCECYCHHSTIISKNMSH